MMTILKEKLYNKKTLILLFGTFLLFILIFLIYKSEFYYQAIHYIDTYVRYYVQKYLNGNFSLLVDHLGMYLYIENDAIHIFSAQYLYLLAIASPIINIFSIIFPFLLYALISKNLYNEIHHKFIVAKIMRMGKKKYITSTLTATVLWGGFLALIPKLLYYLFLLCFFPNGISNTHILDQFSSTILYDLINHYNLNALIIGDFFLTFAYGVLLALISIVVILYSKKYIHSFLTFAIILVGETILSYFLHIMLPLFNFYSLFTVIEEIIKWHIPIILFLIIFYIVIFILFHIVKAFFYKKAREYI